MEKRKNIIICFSILVIAFCCVLRFGLSSQKRKINTTERESASTQHKVKESDKKEDITENQLPMDVIDEEGKSEETSDTVQQKKENGSSSTEEIKKKEEKQNLTTEIEKTGDKQADKKNESTVSKSSASQQKSKKKKQKTSQKNTSTTEKQNLTTEAKKTTEDSGITIVKPEDKEKKDTVELPIDEFQ